MMLSLKLDATTISASEKATTTTRRDVSTSRSLWRRVRWCILDLPFWIVVIVWASTRWISHFYQGPLQTFIESFRRYGSVDELGYYTDYSSDVTYFGRQCDATDISTSDSRDLILPAEVTKEQASNTMLTHGAVIIQNLLSKETASQLREYLEVRHDIKHTLPWHELFYDSDLRLSLGLGVHDAPIIAKALKEVGTNPTLRTSLEAIVGPDPAILEISTLTTMYGAEPQGIHTDSDFFGSSVLYARSFLHSYTLFMALQNTTAKMGATTICPGTHWCANEDLADVCLPESADAPSAFEASSNGQTGRDTGMLYQGDGLMFNQNVWHRGPQNLDPQNPINRVMFILTFASRRHFTKGDVRQQGLGTYYYQRWNVWGHTFEDLKNAVRVMTQPLGALRALGIWKLPSADWGITWLEHSVRQLANKDDYFHSSELPYFLNFLDAINVPRWLLGRNETAINDEETMEWEPFLLQCLQSITNFVDHWHYIALATYVAISSMWNFVAPEHANGKSLVQQTLTKYIRTGLVMLALWHYVTHVSHLGQRIQTRGTWRQPFPNATSVEHLQNTTFPTRFDVLVGSRFDAPYLASMNHMLDYHPGNKEFDFIIKSYESPVLVKAWATQAIEGVTPRFLEQDWQTGYWSIMSPLAISKYIKQQIYARKRPLIARLDTHLKTALANARFGLDRDLVMTRRFTTSMILHLQATLYRNVEPSVEDLQTFFSLPEKTSHRSKNVLLRPSVVLRKTSITVNPSKTPSTFPIEKLDGPMLSFHQGQRVLAPISNFGAYIEAIVLRMVSDTTVEVRYVLNGVSAIVSSSEVRPFKSFVQGDQVELYDYDGQRWLPCKILSIHPLAYANLLYVNPLGIEKVIQDYPLDRIRFIY